MPYSMSKSFAASYDATTKVTTAVLCVFLAVVAGITHSALAVGIGATLLLVTYAYSPRGYLVADGAIIVRRLFGNASLSLQGVREARSATAEDFSGAIRLFADGGLFGYYGLFRTSKLGRCWWYLTNKKNVVVVLTEKQTALYSPDDVNGFLAAVRAAAPVLQGAANQPPPDALFSQMPGSLTGGVGIAVGLIAVAVAAFAFLYSPGPPGCTLTRTSLSIHDRFYPVEVHAADVDLEGVRVVDVAGSSEWRAVMRTNGFGSSHYHSGWFRLANGRTVRMYRAQGTRLVLLPPKGQDNPTVLLEVQQPDDFVRELRQEWGGGRAMRLPPVGASPARTG
jgi:hypothetical protein